MAIDPRIYTKYSGRSGDPHTRLGEALASNVKAQHGRDEMPKGIAGGLRTTAMPGMFAQLFNIIKNWRRPK